MAQQVMQELMEELTETSEQEFGMTMQVMAQQPQFQQMLMAAQQGKLPDEDAAEKAKKQPALNKSKTLKAFELTKKHTMDALGKQAEMQRAASMGQVNEMELMIDMFVEQARIDDELFIKEGVRNDELEAAMMFYIGQDDSDVKKAMTQYMIQMQAEMRKHGGPMPGMGM